ncbi:unnamed protein product, partial [Ectocarpus fasciculatus]
GGSGTIDGRRTAGQPKTVRCIRCIGCRNCARYRSGVRSFFCSAYLHNRGGTTVEKGTIVLETSRGGLFGEVLVRVRTLLVVEKYPVCRKTLTRGCDNTYSYGSFLLRKWWGCTVRPLGMICCGSARYFGVALITEIGVFSLWEKHRGGGGGFR